MNRYLIVTTDDYGMSSDINAACREGMAGLARSVEIMAPAPAFLEGVSALVADRTPADVGVHLTLTSEFRKHRWGPVSTRDEVASLCDEEGYFHEDVVGLERGVRMEEVRRELCAQIDRVRAAGIEPSHFTQHMFVLDELSRYEDEAAEILAHLCHRYRASARVTNPRIAARLIAAGIAVVSQVPTDTMDVPPGEKLERYRSIIREAPRGISELVVHCGYDTAAHRAFSSSGPRRQRDLELVTSDELRKTLEEEGVELIAWRDVASLARATS